MPANKLATSTEAQLREACAELDRRLRAGESVRTEDVLVEFPELATRSECVLELVYTEFVTRDALGESSDVETWYARFPQWAGDLRELFEVHRFVQQAALDTALPQADDTATGSEPPAPIVLFQNSDSDAERRLGNYELIEEIGRGGMGVVYKARQIGVRRTVALKLILAGDHAGRDRYERFQAEAETVGRLAHPNIVQIFEVGNADGRPYLSLEYIEGGGLDQKLSGTPLPPREAAALLTIICDAIQHAHARGVVHRDLKPANILLTVDGVPKVSDFGLAKRLFDDQSGQTASGAMLGTPSYMAPEQALGNSRDSGVAADVYALGAILYEMLTGRPPFRGASLLETLEQVRLQEPVPPRQLVGKLPRDLETICLKCLQKHPAHRYASAADLADDLRRFLDHQPIHARPVGYTGRVTRWAQRNPLLATVSGGLVATVTAIAIVAPIVAVTQASLRAEVQEQLNEVTRQNRAKSASLLATQSRLTSNDTPQLSVLLAREALATHLNAGEAAPVAIEQALRDALANTGGVVLAGHRGQLTAARFTPDGDKLVTASADGTARLWAVGDALAPINGVELAGHQAAIGTLAISGDGRWLATAGADRTARLWDLRTADVAASAQVLSGFRGPVTTVAFRRDNAMLFLVDQTGVGKLFRLTDESSPQLLQELELKAPDAQFSPDGSWLAAGGVDRLVHLWPVTDAGLGAEVTLAGHSGPVMAVAFEPVRPRLVTASADRTLRLWDLAANPPAESSVVLQGHAGTISCATISTDGKWLVSGSYDGTVRRWDLEADDVKASSTILSGHTDRIYALAISPDGQRLASAGKDRTLRLWDLTAAQPGATARGLRGHDGAVHALSFSPDGNWLASASADGTARLWNLPNNLPAAGPVTTYAHNGARVERLAVSDPGRWLASAASDKVVRIWDRQSRRVVATLPHEFPVQFLALSGDDRFLVSAEIDRSPPAPRVWDLRKLDTPSSRRLTGHTQNVESLLVDRAGQWVATGAVYDDAKHERDGTVRVWSLDDSSGAAGRVVVRHDADVVTLIQFPKSNELLSASSDGVIRVTSLLPGGAHAESRLVRFDGFNGRTDNAHHRAIAKSLTGSTDGRWLAAHDATRRILLWDLSGWNEPTAALPPPTIVAGDEAPGLGMWRLLLSPDGARLAAYGTDGAIRVWDLRRAGAGQAPVIVRGHTQAVQTAAFAPDGRSLFSGGHDGTIREWPLETADLLSLARRVVGRDLTDGERRSYVEQ